MPSATSRRLPSGLVTTPLGSVARAVYCGRRHPLFRATHVTAGDFERAEFVAPPPGDDGVVPDGWPPDRSRQVAMVVDQLRVGLELCLRLPLLAVLPDVLAVGVPGLRRLPSNLIADSRLYATHRRVLGPKPPLAVQVVELVRARVEASAP